jgi:hypothetical protein
LTSHARQFVRTPDGTRSSKAGARMPQAASFDAHAMTSRPVVLCIGNDAALLSYRTEVLRLGGFEVVCLCPASRQREQLPELCRRYSPAVSLACHSLTHEQRLLFAHYLRVACPSSRLLALTNGNLLPDEAATYDTLLDSLDGPQVLIETLRAQL